MHRGSGCGERPAGSTARPWTRRSEPPTPLIEAGLADEGRRDALDAVAARYATAIPPAFRALIAAPDDPIGLQVIPPSVRAGLGAARAVGPDRRRRVLAGAGDRAPLPPTVRCSKPLLVCPLYCRFCFRRERVGPGGGMLDKAALERGAGLARPPSGGGRGDPHRRRPADAVAAPARPHPARAGGDGRTCTPSASIPACRWRKPERLTEALAATLDSRQGRVAGAARQPRARADAGGHGRRCAGCRRARCRVLGQSGACCAA